MVITDDEVILKVLLIEKKYTNNWDDFIKLYSTFAFGNNSYLQVKNGNTGSQNFSNLNDNTNYIKDKQPADLSNGDNAYYNDWNSDDYYKFRVEKDYDNGYYWSQMCFALYLWHDDNNIYYQISAVIAVHDIMSNGYGYQYNLDNITFNNGMK
ncbi:hypothetical protein [Spiroplasma sp. AdecLV25b]|uniref:hypothetical protein n=1 Tax=Spiroplasma sp. AdecLV25b TaxID=3027162 RepID=UPI0027E178EB|nr:hypothetical protein [Spiroplasma sp. AdecLV25b]